MAGWSRLSTVIDWLAIKSSWPTTAKVKFHHKALLVKYTDGPSRIYTEVSTAGGEVNYWSKDLKPVNEEHYLKNLDVFMDLTDIVAFSD